MQATKKPRTSLTVRRETWKQFKATCALRGISMGQEIEEAVKLYLHTRKTKNKKGQTTA
jgi:hypothetical protein